MITMSLFKQDVDLLEYEIKSEDYFFTKDRFEIEDHPYWVLNLDSYECTDEEGLGKKIEGNPHDLMLFKVAFEKMLEEIPCRITFQGSNGYEYFEMRDNLRSLGMPSCGSSTEFGSRYTQESGPPPMWSRGDIQEANQQFVNSVNRVNWSLPPAECTLSEIQLSRAFLSEEIYRDIGSRMNQRYVGTPSTMFLPNSAFSSLIEASSFYKPVESVPRITNNENDEE